MPFCDVYVVRAGDDLTKIARSKGYKTPAAIIAFPDNKVRFATPAKQNLIRPGEKIIIPWHPLLLKKLIATSEFLASKVAEEDISEMDLLESFIILIVAFYLFAAI